MVHPRLFGGLFESSGFLVMILKVYCAPQKKCHSLRFLSVAFTDWQLWYSIPEKALF